MSLLHTNLSLAAVSLGVEGQCAYSILQGLWPCVPPSTASPPSAVSLHSLCCSPTGLLAGPQMLQARADFRASLIAVPPAWNALPPVISEASSLLLPILAPRHLLTKWCPKAMWPSPLALISFLALFFFTEFIIIWHTAYLCLSPATRLSSVRTWTFVYFVHCCVCSPHNSA